MNLDSRVVIITGATSGIGLEAAIEIARYNPCIVLPVRNMKKGEQAKKQIAMKSGNPSVYLMDCDLSSFDSIRSFATGFKKRFDQLDLLVNNAGLWERERRESHDGIEMNFAVNHLASFLLTNLLIDEIRAAEGARIVNVSSEAHRYLSEFNFDDPEGKKRYSSFRAYGQSKLANILFTRHLSGILQKDGVAVNCLHPGVVATNLFDKLNPIFRSVFSLFMTSPRQGAQTTIYLSTSSELNSDTGGYYIRKKKRRPSNAALSDDAARRLWDLSRQYTGI